MVSIIWNFYYISIELQLNIEPVHVFGEGVWYTQNQWNGNYYFIAIYKKKLTGEMTEE